MTTKTYTPEEQAKARRLWVEALRSGGYKQGTDQLHHPGADTYCCLGVACEVAVQQGVIESYRPDDGGLSGDQQPVADWLGINPHGELEGPPKGAGPGAQTLINLNDNERWTFEQIADVIESGAVLPG